MPFDFTTRVNGGQIDASHVNELQAALESSGAVLRVAAADATQREKDWSHYVCDGAADQAEINAAVTALPANGGTVVLSAGTFSLNAPVSLGKNAVFLKGQGREATRLVVVSGANATAVQYPSRAGVTTDYGGVADLTIRGQDTLQPGAGPYHGIDAFATRYLLFERLRITSCKGKGINLHGDSVTGGDNLGHFGWWNTVRDCWIEFTTGALFMDNSEANTVGGCTLTDTHGTNYTVEMLSGGHLFVGNTLGSQLTDNDRGLLRLGNDLTVKIVGNRFDGARRDHIHVDSSNHVIVGNEFFAASGETSNTYDTIELNAGNCTILGNTFVAGYSGVPRARNHIRENAGVALPNVVVGNGFYMASVGPNYFTASSVLSVVRNNAGYVTERSGTGTITAGTSVVVTHGLATTPTRVFVTPTTSVAQTLSVTTKGATTFTVTASASTTVAFDWFARLNDGG